MQGNGQPELLFALSQLEDAGNDANGRHGNPPRAHAVTLVENGQGRVKRLSITERLAHSHVHDVGNPSVAIVEGPPPGEAVLGHDLA